VDINAHFDKILQNDRRRREAIVKRQQLADRRAREAVVQAREEAVAAAAEKARRSNQANRAAAAKMIARKYATTHGRGDQPAPRTRQ